MVRRYVGAPVLDGLALSLHQRAAATNTKLPESGCDFILHDADGEGLMRHECPEIWRGKAESGKQKVEIGGQQVETPEIAEGGWRRDWEAIEREGDE
jgi:hypothetical protein